MRRRHKVPIKGEIVEVPLPNPVFSASTEERWTRAKVQDLLSTQFTAIMTELPNDPLRYSFYHDYGISWRYPK